MSIQDETEYLGHRRFASARERLALAQSRDDLIEAVRLSARDACGSDGITFILREGRLCHYVEEDAIGPLWVGQRFPLENCISGWSMLHRQTAVIEDVFADPRIPHDAYRPTFVKSLIMCPVGDGATAAIGAYWRDIRSFSDMEVLTVKTLAMAIGRTLDGVL